MRLTWAIVAGLAVGIGIAWWLSRDPPQVAKAKQARAEGIAAERAEAARPVLYRWTDAAGVVQITQDPPPKGRRYETLDVQPRDGIEVHGTRQ